MSKPDLTEFNGGGTHEQNPIGGIPQGKGPNGTPNTVEDGETKLTVGGVKYVFSDRYPVQQRFIDAMGLPTYIKNMSFAEASKEIAKRFKDRVDNASVSTEGAFLDRLVEAQETAKLEKEAKDAGMSVEGYMAAKAEQEVAQAEAQAEAQAAQEMEQAQQMAANEQPVEEQQQFAEGGAIGNAAVSGGLDMIGAAMGDLNSDEEVRAEKSIGGSAAKYAAMGASAGSVVPGIGTAIGAGVGAIGGAAVAAISNSKIAGEQQEKMRKDQGQRILNDGYQAKWGGKMNEYAEGDPLVMSNQLGSTFSLEDQYNLDFEPEIEEDPEAEDTRSGGNKWAGIGALGASLAPFVGNLVEGASLKQDDPNRYARTGRTYRPEFADEQKRLNIVDESFAGAPDAIAAATAGNVGAYRANLLGSNINKSKARSAAFGEINDINRGERKMLNEDAAMAAREETMLTNRERVEDRQDKAAYDSARAEYRRAAYEGLGKIGETIFSLNQMQGLSPYDTVTGKRKQDEA